MNGIVYKITNLINGKAYVGITTKTLERRLKIHMTAKNEKHLPFHRALNKYGLEGFSCDILIDDEPWEELCKLEKYYIKHFNCKSPNGYNLTDGGEGFSGFKWTEEQKKNHSMHNPEFLIRNKEFMSSEKNPMKNPEVVKKFIGENNPAKRLEVREKISIGKRECAPDLEIDGIVYSCVPEAMEKLNITYRQAWWAGRKGTLEKKKPGPLKNKPEKQKIYGISGDEHWTRKSPEKILIGSDNHKARQVTIDGITYGSLVEAGEKLGITRSQVDTAAKKGTLKKIILSGDEHPNKRPENRAKISSATKGKNKNIGSNNQAAVPIIIDCVVYGCKKEAAKAFGVCASTIDRMIKNGKAKILDKEIWRKIQ